MLEPLLRFGRAALRRRRPAADSRSRLAVSVAPSSVAPGLIALLLAIGGLGAAEAAGPPAWRVDQVDTDTSRRRTRVTLVGRDAARPVAARIRLVAPRGSVWIRVDPVCFYGSSWVPGGNTIEELESRGQPIVRLLSLGVDPRPDAGLAVPTYCRWNVWVTGPPGTLLIELHIRDA